MRTRGCIVVLVEGDINSHVTVIVMSNEGPYLADLQNDNRYLHPINNLLNSGRTGVLRYDPDSDSATVGKSILSHRCTQGQRQKRKIKYRP